ncbi:WG repeat-containing protein [Candidatus Formimonas warabiya]|uniref:WG repeat-containing protein n=1 Tax=Formimonas warabiya TaxID=1761012 RepID=A0A3G1KRT5_FORW1|nr:WG repeat-containing protein [Candidatus Formimonas warabiya]ATW25094.1 hypothetical protein DCMF_10185 [Candidatus Formimonas warabiya]
MKALSAYKTLAIASLALLLVFSTIACSRFEDTTSIPSGEASWAYPFVKWDGRTYVVTDEAVAETETKKMLGMITKHSTNELDEFPDNSSNYFPEKTKLYEIAGLEPEQYIAVATENGALVKAIEREIWEKTKKALPEAGQAAEKVSPQYDISLQENWLTVDQFLEQAFSKVEGFQKRGSLVPVSLRLTTFDQVAHGGAYLPANTPVWHVLFKADGRVWVPTSGPAVQDPKDAYSHTQVIDTVEIALHAESGEQIYQGVSGGSLDTKRQLEELKGAVAAGEKEHEGDWVLVDIAGGGTVNALLPRGMTAEAVDPASGTRNKLTFWETLHLPPGTPVTVRGLTTRTGEFLSYALEAVVPDPNEKIEETTKTEQVRNKQPLPQNEATQKEETKHAAIIAESPEDEKISARYWLGDSGEKTVEYGLKTGKEGQKNLLNDKGETILSGFAEYDLMLNLIFAKKDGKWGLYDKTGQRIIDHMYEEIANYEMPDGNKANGLVKVKKNGLWGAVDQEGNIVIRPEFEYVELNYYEEIEPFIKVEKNEKFGYLTQEGQPLVDTVWDAAFMDVLNVPEDIIFVKQGEKWGGIRVEDYKAAPVDWNLVPSEEAQLSFNNWKYAHQGSFYRQQIRDGKTDITERTKRFFNDYFRTNTMELRCLPVFALGKNPIWDDLTLFIVLNTPHQWSNGSMSKEQFAETVTRYFGDISYTHKSSGYLEYQDGKYTAVGLSFHGFYIYELKNLEKGQTADGKDSWKAQITGYYFYEMDGDPNDSFSSKNAQAVYQEMEKEEYYGLSFWQACDRLVWNNPGSILDPAVEWQIEFTVNDPLGDIWFTYLSCAKKDFE